MSMELQVFSNRRLSSLEDWQHAIDSESYPVQLSVDMRLEAIGGFLPALLNGRVAGFECFQDDAVEAMKSLGRHHFDRPWKFALGLRWLGSRMEELLSAWMAATAYAATTGGVIFDHEEGKIFTPEQARITVQRIERDIPLVAQIEAELAKRFRPPGSS